MREVVIYYTNGTHATFHLAERVTHHYVDYPSAEEMIEFAVTQLTPQPLKAYEKNHWVVIPFQEGKLYMIPGQIAMILLKTETE